MLNSTCDRPTAHACYLNNIIIIGSNGVFILTMMVSIENLPPCQLSIKDDASVVVQLWKEIAANAASIFFASCKPRHFAQSRIFQLKIKLGKGVQHVGLDNLHCQLRQWSREPRRANKILDRQKTPRSLSCSSICAEGRQGSLP